MQRVSTVTRKGQVTIPNEIRAALGIFEGDKIAFQLEDGALTLRNLGRVATRPGLAPPGWQKLTAEEERRLTGDFIAAAAMERSGGGQR